MKLILLNGVEHNDNYSSPTMLNALKINHWLDSYVDLLPNLVPLAMSGRLPTVK